jgi:uncharacterized protein YllA (UPF0747 family)
MFSPNVIMRPLFQEVILPNLCYMEGRNCILVRIKIIFNAGKSYFPDTLVRNSVLLATEKQVKKSR